MEQDLKRPIDRKRFRRVRGFFFRAFVHVFIFDVVFNRNGLRWLRPKPEPRWQKIAARYRILALELGGVLIKLGQFLSIRVDLLPTVVTTELAGLRDKVPAERFSDIKKRIEQDFGCPLSEVFPHFERQPMAAASLAQAHEADLPSGEKVVVKVQRPGIQGLVETDLAALNRACSWLKFYKTVSRRVDLDWLSEEFGTVTRAELDFIQEGLNIEAFRQHFGEDKRLTFPKVYKAHTTTHVLTMENVGFIKIDDIGGLERVGIDGAKVAAVFFTFFMEQVFDQHLVHADPHPGNVFIEPLPVEKERAAGRTRFLPGEPVHFVVNRPFRIAMVDYGMVGKIPERMRKALREYVVAIASRDAHGVVQSYVHGGTLLPGADLVRLEEAHELLFEHIWGLSMDKIQNAAMGAFGSLMDDYRDLLFKTPFQVQVDLLFALRGLELVNAVATNLDAQFNTWETLKPFAAKLTGEEFLEGARDWPQRLLEQARMWFNLPKRIESVLSQAERGKLTIRNDLTRESRTVIKQVEIRLRHMERTLLIVGLLLAGTYARINGNPDRMGDGLLVAAGLVFLWRLLFR